MKSLEQYELLESRTIKELATEASVYRHRKSGARVFTMKNSDDNRVFSIAFRTPATDSTGAAHILEHSVLCGSDKYPLKDPFVELAKGSLNTFLNAMTYPDKTVYPIASTNLKDFGNLMDVYMDAVLNPRCLKDERTFLQEGWHYELEEAEGELRLNGVVYNEMKGAFSSPDAVLERHILHSVFPDTTYGNESGGDPEVIPSLSYEDFVAFHRRYYHPSNSYIILYGDLDMEERLSYLDKEYLSKYDAIDPKSDILFQSAFQEMRREEARYAIGDNEPLDNNTYLAYTIVPSSSPKDSSPAKRNMAFSILEYALLDAPGAPLKQALLDSDIGKDVYGRFEDGIMQPYFSITAKNAEAADETSFLSIIEETLTKLANEGLDKKTLLSAINHDEFQYREADYGSTPKGLVYSLSALDSWLYGKDPWIYLECEALYEELRKEVESGCFEELIKENLINNPHSSLLVLKPERGLTEKKASDLALKLQKKKESLSASEINKLCENTEALRIYQDTPTDPADLMKLPLLSRSDIGKKAREYIYSRRDSAGTKLLYTPLKSRGIIYLKFNFNTALLTEEELMYASFLGTALGYMDTDKHTFQDLSSDIYLHTGGITFSVTAYPKVDKYNHYTGYFCVDARLLYRELDFALDIIEEILHTTHLWDRKRMTDILNETRSRERMRLESASHSYAVNRAGAYLSASSRYQDLIGGISYYRFIENIAKTYGNEEVASAFTEKLISVAMKLFSIDRLLISAGSEEEGMELLEKALPGWVDNFKTGALALSKADGIAKEKNAGFEFDMSGILDSEAKAKTVNKAKTVTNEKTVTNARSVTDKDNEDYEGNKGLNEKKLSRPQLILSGKLNEGFRTPSQVNYVSRFGRFDSAKMPYTGAFKVLTVILNLEYLWLCLRVKGGAYGCMSGFNRSGEGFLVSYRDPHLKETEEVYNKLPSYLRNFTASDREMTKYVIGTISGLDTPKTNYSLFSSSLSAYLCGISNEMLQKERDEVLSCTEDDIRSLAPYIEEILAAEVRCTIGNASSVDEAKDLFMEVRDLFT